MNDDKKILNKKLLRREIILNHFFSYIIAIVFMFVFCWLLYLVNGKNPEEAWNNPDVQMFTAFSIIGAVYLLIDSIIMIRHILRINSDNFFIMKSVIIRKEAEDDSYFFIFHNINNCADGSIVHSVSSHTYHWYKNGDCFYLVFYDKEQENYSKVRNMFPCDRYDIDGELMVNYADYAKWHKFEENIEPYEVEDNEKLFLENYEKEESYGQSKFGYDRKRVYQEETPEKNRTLKWVATILNKITGIVVGFISIVTIMLLYDEMLVEDQYLLVIFGLAAIVSLLMVFTKLKMLFLLYVTAFFSGAAILTIVDDKDYVTGLVLAVIAIIPVLPVLICNIKNKMKKKRIHMEENYGY